MNSIIQGLIGYILDCPWVEAASFAGVNADWTEAENNNLALAASNSRIIKTYLDGSVQKENDYVLLLKAYMGENQARLEQNVFLENFQEWIQEQNRKRHYPDIGLEKTVRQISAANGMLLHVEQNQSGVYQVQIKLTYFQQGGR